MTRTQDIKKALKKIIAWTSINQGIGRVYGYDKIRSKDPYFYEYIFALAITSFFLNH